LSIKFARNRKLRPAQLRFEPLEARHVLAANPIITEFMASNDTTINDGFGDDSDWIEIYNAGDESVDLQGYHLTDDHDEIAKWTFPSSTVLAPDEYLIVFASSDDTLDPGGYWHTNFKLSAGGEYVALAAPDMTVLSEFGTNGADYPAQFTDVSYGLAENDFVSGNSAARYLIPSNGTLGDSWRQPGFDATANGFTLGRAAIGYEDGSGYQSLIETELPSGTTSTYLLAEFSVADASSVPDLNLNLLYDDGVVVYLNGTEVFSGQAPADPVWNSQSNGDRPDATVLAGTDISLDDQLGLLQDGTNVIAFHLLNLSAGSSDYLLVPTLSSSQGNAQAGYLQSPTPGTANTGNAALGPAIRDVTMETVNPGSGQPIVVTAQIDATLNPLDVGSVTLHRRVMFGAESATMMVDDGSGADAVASDGVFTAEIPGAAAGELVRWYVTAEDSLGELTRDPRFPDEFDSAEYYGTVIEDSTASDDLPVLYWFVEDTVAAQTREGTQATLYYLGQLYDNIHVDLHGQTTATDEFPKKSFDFDANTGEKFRFAEDVGRASDFNLLTNYGDQSKLRNTLSNGAFAASGGAHNLAFPVSVHRNGDFFGLYDLVEEGDSEYLERQGLDPEGAFYKVNNPLDSATFEVDKLTREHENNDDLQELVDARALNGTAARIWDYDNLDLADMVNYIAQNSVLLNLDYGHKNMYWYRDTNGSEFWSVLPWDVDLSLGHIWNQNDGYFYDPLHTTDGVEWSLNSLFARMYTDPRIESMYYRRLRTLMDAQLGTAGMAPADSYLGQELVNYESLIADEALADLAEWGLHPNFTRTPSQAADQLLNSFIPLRRNYLESRPQLPDAHGATADIQITEVDFDPTSGNDLEQYVRLTNNESFAVDISDWMLGGTADHVFKAGTVIPANSELYLVADVPGFKERTTGPRGGQQRFLQQNAAGVMNSTVGVLVLTNADGTTIDSESYGLTFDLDQDGALACGDVNTLSTAIAQGSSDLAFDLSADGVVDSSDLETWLLVAGETNLGPGRGYLPADANLDGTVDGGDFVEWNTNKFTANSEFCSGDFNADGFVNGADFVVWNSHKFTSADATSGGGPALQPTFVAESTAIGSKSLVVRADDVTEHDSLDQTTERSVLPSQQDREAPASATRPQTSWLREAGMPAHETRLAANDLEIEMRTGETLADRAQRRLSGR
jgi:hypothetical protein